MRIILGSDEEIEKIYKMLTEDSVELMILKYMNTSQDISGFKKFLKEQMNMINEAINDKVLMIEINKNDTYQVIFDYKNNPKISIVNMIPEELMVMKALENLNISDNLEKISLTSIITLCKYIVNIFLKRGIYYVES